jgi:hypothetical protein
VRIFLKYTNDNNPFQEASIRPATVTDGLSKIGGYFALFGIINVIMFMYNERSFQRSLTKRYKTMLIEFKEGKR